MAKRSNSNRGNASNYSTANRRLSSPTQITPVTFNRNPYESILDQGYGQHDRRFYNPTRSTSGPATIHRASARVNVDRFASLRDKGLPWRLEYSTPRDVAVCIRRKVRKEVLLALRRTAGGAGKPKRRNIYSGTICR